MRTAADIEKEIDEKKQLVGEAFIAGDLESANRIRTEIETLWVSLPSTSASASVHDVDNTTLPSSASVPLSPPLSSHINNTQSTTASAISAACASPTNTMISATDDKSHCAACGKEGDGLKACTACRRVKYCSVSCQKAHRSDFL
mmetsp:Transcript_10050/g.22476  ORF Transcript_10050/g.22476 Transcript_10050/m.22476 type:complete len:145 (-) Transcript_10050:61-495(-)